MNLTERAMLVRLSIGQWVGRKKDKRVTGNVIRGAAAAQDAGSWWTYLVPKNALEEIHAASVAARFTFYRWTLPWTDEGYRILLSTAYLDLVRDLRRIEQRFRAGVEAFLARYSEWTAEAVARERLGDLYQLGVFPTQAQLRKCFHWSVEVIPLPDARDFRVNLGEAEVSRLRGEIEAQLQDTFSRAAADVWPRLLKVVQHAHEKLSDPEAKFRDSLIRNIRELCTDVLPKLNLLDDPSMEQVRQDVLRQLGELDPQQLRDVPQDRQAAAQAAADLLKKIDSYRGAAR